MPLVFKAPVEFFLSDLYPDRCLLTGRTENLRHFDVQLPFLNAGISAPVLQLRYNDPPKNATASNSALLPATPSDLPPPQPRTPAGADPTSVAPPRPGETTGHPPLPQQSRGWFAQLFGTLLWIFLAGWLGRMLSVGVIDRNDEYKGALIGAAVMAGWILLYNLVIKHRHRASIAARALHFTVAIADPTPAERNTAFALTILHTVVASLYWVMILVISAPRGSLPFPVSMGVFWIVWLLLISVQAFRNKRLPFIRLHPKQRELEIRFPDTRKNLYDDLCTRFMRWRDREHFPTAIRYDIDSQIDDFPEVESGSWDQGDR